MAFDSLNLQQKIAVATYLGYIQSSGTVGEWVGKYQDDASVSYKQTGSRFTEAQLNAMYSANSKQSVNQYGDAVWVTSYQVTSGDRKFDMASTDKDSTRKWDPNWMWKTTITETKDPHTDAAFTSTGAPSATWYRDGSNQGTISTVYTKNITADSQYFDALQFDTASLTQTSESTRTNQMAGSFSYWTNWTERYLGYVNSWSYQSWDWRAWYIGSTRTGMDTVRSLASSHDEVQTKSRTSSDCLACRDDKKYYVRYRDNIQIQVKEDFKDFVYEWKSEWKNIYDQRIQLDYQLTYQSEDIFEKRHIYAEITQELMAITYENQTVWETQEITDTQEVTRAISGAEDLSGIGANFSGNALQAQNITIQTGGKTTITGLMTAEEDISIQSKGNLQVKGVKPAGADFETPVWIKAGDELTFSTQADLLLSVASPLSGAT
jgi:carbon monoxide dehydrogenase subunit G